MFNFDRFKERLNPRTAQPCEHDYRYADLELWNNATLTWWWCFKCGEPKPREQRRTDEKTR